MAQRIGDTADFSTVNDDLCAQLHSRISDITPDFLELKLEHHIPILVYGTLKIGGMFHGAIKDYPFLGDALTQQAAYTMKETSSFPVAFHTNKVNDPAYGKRGRLFGEAFVVDPKAMIRLDEIEDNGRMYVRKKTWIKLINQPAGQSSIIQAWVYTGLADFWADAGGSIHDVDAKQSSGGAVYAWEPRVPNGRRNYIEDAYELNDNIPF